MKTIGIFEVRTRFSRICEEVARSGEGVVVTRRCKPLVRIVPVVAEQSSIWEEREKYISLHGRFREEFKAPVRNAELPASTLND